MVLGTHASKVIITKGLGLQPATKGFITSFFSLVLSTAQAEGGGGSGETSGAYPGLAHNVLPPGEVQDFYKPVDEQLYHHVPRDKENEYLSKRKTVILTVKLNDSTIEKIYKVSEYQTKHVFNIINIMNKTRDKVSISINNIERLYNKISVSVRNLFKIKR